MRPLMEEQADVARNDDRDAGHYPKPKALHIGRCFGRPVIKAIEYIRTTLLAL
jgi:hypothetical protein